MSPFPDSTNLELTKENIEKVTARYRLDLTKIPEDKGKPIEFQKCYFCLRRDKEDLCDSIRPVLPKRVASALVKWLTASPVERAMKQTQSVSSTLTVAIGRSKIVAITSSIGTMMKTEVESAQVTPGKYHPNAPIRYRGYQIQKRPQCRAENARVDTQCSLGPRLPPDDTKIHAMFTPERRTNLPCDQP